MDAHVLVERNDSVLSIMLARPERRNAITVAMYAALADAIESAADNRSLRLITIEGQGDRMDVAGITVPVVIEGPLEDPAIRPDLSGLIDQTIRDPEELRRYIAG